MMSKKPRWPDSLVNSKANKPMPKKTIKESKLPASTGKQSTSTKSAVNVGRSHSFCSRDWSSGSRGGGGTQEQSHVGLKDSRSTGSRTSRPSIRLCSSRSFSSLHGSSFSNAPFIRSSRSLNRLDQKARDEKGLESGKFSTSLETLRDSKDSPSSSNEDMKTSHSRQSLESSSVATCHHHSNDVKKKTRDGVYTLCAMTSGMRRNWVQAVLRNVRPNATPAITDSITEQNPLQQDFSQSSGALEKDNQRSGVNDHKDKDENSTEHKKEVNEVNADLITCIKGLGSAQSLPTSASILSSTSAINHQSKERIEHSIGFLQTTENEVSRDEHSNGDLNTMLAHSETARRQEEHSQQPINNCRPCAQGEADLLRGNHTGQLVKELEKTRRELSQLQQINRNLLERERHLNEMSLRQGGLSNTTSSLDQVALQQLQKINQELRVELEAQKKSQEEAREAELRRRVDLLAQQAQLLVTGDATTLAQAQLELDRRRFNEKQLELEQSISSLTLQLQVSEEKRTEAESRLAQVQEELESLCNLQQEANQLREDYQEVASQLRAYEETQAQKESRLEKHLMLLQASQERERKSLAASLAQAERRSQDLQEQLGRAEEQVENLNKTQEWTREIQEAQEQLQEELQQTVCAMQQLQEDKDRLEHQCQELQTQVCESNGEVNRLQGRLQTDETQFYNLEHSYERVCEELQVALGKVLQWETEAQEMREGYERQLDQKEQELTEVLLKMEVLGNSLEETEMRLNEALKEKEQRRNQITTNTDNVNVESSLRLRSRSVDYSAIADGDDPERFASVIQLLETKLYVTEEKLRNITQRLEDYQSHVTCQDPLLCSQLTQTRANAQHLSLLLHTQAKHNQRFAQEMENRCRMLVGRFQVALNIVQACRGRLQEAGSHIDVEDFEKQLATLVNCLQQGEKDAEKQQHESRYACKEEERILNDKTLTNSIHLLEDTSESVGKCLSREIFVVETMINILQSKNVNGQLQVQKKSEGTLSQRYQSLQAQIIALKVQSRNDESVESVVSSACVEAELIYKVFKFLQNSNMEGSQPSEQNSYEKKEEVNMQRQEKTNEDTKSDKKCVWVEELISTLQKRAVFLRQMSQDIPEANEKYSNTDLKRIYELAKSIFLTHKLYLDLKEESNNHLQPRTTDREIKDTICQLEDDNCLLREELRQAEQRVHIVETGNQNLLEDIQKIESYHEERMQKLEKEFKGKIQELQRIHEEEMKHLHNYYSKCFSKEKLNKLTGKSDSNQSHGNMVSGSSMEEQDKSERFSALEEMHKKLIADLQQQHQKEVANLLKEKDQLLKEETAATMAAIVAMRRTHKEELEKTRRSQNTRENADVSQLHIEYEKELQVLNKDLELLSVQHTQKCLENSQLSQELQELKRKKRGADDTSSLHTLNGSHITPDGTDSYEMDVLLRAREAEMQFLRQEAMSLKEELKLARMDTIYAQNKLKSLCLGTPDEKLYEDVNKCATWSPGRQERSQMSEDGVTNKNDVAAENKTSRLSITRRLRAVRSKSLREGISVQERMKLFES